LIALIVSVSEQANTFLIAVLSGIVIGIFYDIFRIIRKIIPHPNWLVQLEDLIYWIIVSAFMFLVLFTNNYGEIRGFALLGAFLGNILYFFTLSIIVMKFSDWIIYWLKKTVTALIKMILIPLKLVLRIFYYPLKWISYPVKRFTHKSRFFFNRVQNKLKRKIRQIFKELYIMCRKV